MQNDSLSLKSQLINFLNKISETTDNDDKPYETRNSHIDTVAMDKKLVDQWKTIDNYYQK